jgi:hypothetical protein
MKQSLSLLTKACTDLKEAKLFRELLNVILVMGNYLNGTNYAGGAFGFKVASINRVRPLCRSLEKVLTILACRHEIVKRPESTPFPRTRRLDPFPAPRRIPR